MALEAVWKHLGVSWRHLEATWQLLRAPRKRLGGLQGRILETCSVFLHGSRKGPGSLEFVWQGSLAHFFALREGNQEMGSRQTGQDPRAPDWDPIGTGLQGQKSLSPRTARKGKSTGGRRLLDRGKDYFSQPWFPWQAGAGGFRKARCQRDSR